MMDAMVNYKGKIMLRLIVAIVFIFTPLTTFSQGIDFNAYQRGKRQAERDRLEAERNAYERMIRQNQLQEMEWNRIAESHLASIANNLEIGLNAGQTPQEFIVLQREQVLAYPVFQSYPPQVKAKILSGMREMAIKFAAQANSEGRTDSANTVARAFGLPLYQSKKNVHGDLRPSDIFRQLSPRVALISAFDGKKNVIRKGSGVFIPSQSLGKDTPFSNLIVTNCHVVDGSYDNIVGVSVEGAAGLGVIYGRNEGVDLCTVAAALGKEQGGEMLRDKESGNYISVNIPVVDIASSMELAIGEEVYAIGSPLGLGNTFSSGIVSGFRVDKGSRLIQTTTPISPGSSGGGLFDAQGRLVGVVVMYLEGGQNLNFAIPAEYINSIPFMKSELP